MTNSILEDTKTAAPVAPARSVSRNLAEQLFQSFATCDYDILRVKAVQGLRDIAANNSEEILIAALHDDDEDVRVDAAEALGKLGTLKAGKALLENLVHDPCADVKLAAIEALRFVGAQEAAPILRQLVVGRGDGITWDEQEVYMDEWDGWLDIQIAAIKALGELKDADAIEPIITAMNDPEAQNLDIYAMRAFVQIGDAALPTIGICAQSSQRMRRLYAVKAASQFTGEAAIKILQTALKDKDDDIRLTAFEALLKLAPSVELFEAALEDDNEKVRIAAYNKLELDAADYLGRALADPSPKVKLALIDRLSGKPFKDKSDPIFKALMLLTENTHTEVAASALAVLAVSAPEAVKYEVRDLFEKEDGNPDEREQTQWAVVDALDKTPRVIGLDWLELATTSHSRSIRLKALTTIGKLAAETALSSEDKARALAMLMAYAEQPNEEELPEPDQMEESGGEGPVADDQAEDQNEAFQDQNAEDIAGMKAAGLDLGDETDQSEGPTSSLGAILGHEAIAQDLIAEAAEENLQPRLNLNEQALLNQARRNLSRRKISLDGDEELMARELSLTAIQLLGDHQAAYGLLMHLASSQDADICAAALETLARLAPERDEQGKVDPAYLELVGDSLTSTHLAVRLQALRLVVISQLHEETVLSVVQECLEDGEARIRAEAIKVYVAMNGEGDRIEPMLEDPSIVVRQAAMRELIVAKPDLAVARAVDFLVANPELSLEKMLGGAVSSGELRNLAVDLVDRLGQKDRKAQWGIYLDALAECFRASHAVA